MVCELRPLLYSLGPNISPRICFTPGKSRVKNLCCNKQGNCRSKMAGTGIHSLDKLRAQIPWFATTGITPWQTALKHTVDSQAPCSNTSFTCGQIRPVTIRSQNLDYCPQYGNFIRGNPRCIDRGLPQSAVHI
jgi:hypothetical protein